MLRSLAEVDRRFGGGHCLHYQRMTTSTIALVEALRTSETLVCFSETRRYNPESCLIVLLRSERIKCFLPD